MTKNDNIGISPRALLNQIGRQHIHERYKNHGRFIDPELYARLKAKRECDNCHKTINYKPLIHHIVPVSKGGSNTEENLQALCAECHKEKDTELGVEHHSHKEDLCPRCDKKFQWFKKISKWKCQKCGYIKKEGEHR